LHFNKPQANCIICHTSTVFGKFVVDLHQILAMTDIQQKIEAAWLNRDLLAQEETRNTIERVVEMLDKGELRVAEPTANGWQVNEWIKKAVILYFPIKKMETTKVGPFEFHDKIPLKHNYEQLGVRVVPHAIARYGSYVASGVIMMPSYVNIGAQNGFAFYANSFHNNASAANKTVVFYNYGCGLHGF